MITNQRIMLKLPNTFDIILKTIESITKHRDQQIDQQDTSHRHVTNQKNKQHISTQSIIL